MSGAPPPEPPTTIENSLYFLIFEQIMEKFSSNFRKFPKFCNFAIAFFDRRIENFLASGGEAPPSESPLRPMYLIILIFPTACAKNERVREIFHFF